MRTFLSFVILHLLLCGMTACRHDDLASRIDRLVSGHDALVGVAVIIDDSDTVVVNNDCRYPLMSVFKFHQALAVCNELQQKSCPLDMLVHVLSDELKPDTYSPLRADSVADAFDISVARLLRYTLQLSDNNACDILFDSVIGVAQTDAYIRSLGIEDFAIVANENDMHVDIGRCYDNWSSPLALAELVNMFCNGDILDGPYHRFLYDTLIECRTGTGRLPRPLIGTGAVIGHKTGTADRDSSGRIIAVNDVGFVELPDGTHYTIAVLVRDSARTMEETESIIADVSALVYDYVMQQASEKPSRR